MRWVIITYLIWICLVIPRHTVMGYHVAFVSFVCSFSLSGPLSTFTSKFYVKPMFSLGGGTCRGYMPAPAHLLLSGVVYTITLQGSWGTIDDIPITPFHLVLFAARGGRVVRWCWVNFQCQGVLLVWIRVGQGATRLAVGVSKGCLDIFFLVYHFFFFPLSLWETA